MRGEVLLKNGVHAQVKLMQGTKTIFNTIKYKTMYLGIKQIRETR